MKELRCKKCNRLLGTTNRDNPTLVVSDASLDETLAYAEIKCIRCKTLNTFKL